VVSDGQRFTVLPFSHDHKRLLDGDEGPNTGGMGAYAPLLPSMVSADQEQKIMDIAQRSIEGMQRRGTPYQGVSYIGIVLANELAGDPVVIEYNARFGDPETQVVLPVLSQAGVDVTELLRSAAEGHLKEPNIPSQLGAAAVTICMAAQGYPESPVKGKTIFGVGKEYPGVIIHQAGTKKEDGLYKTAGGRVLYVTGVGPTYAEAKTRASYVVGNKVTFLGAQYRHDIGHAVLEA
jgi:phosphoribosylamine--glycine ligase